MTISTSAETIAALAVDKLSTIPLTDQIHQGLRSAILAGVLLPNTRLPSWQDLATQLGVARGTVRRAYDRLTDEQLIESRGAAGTWVSSDAQRGVQVEPGKQLPTSRGGYYKYNEPPGIFQMGIPAQDALPLTQWAAVWRDAVRAEFKAPLVYCDPCGDAELRQQIAAYLAIARGLRCTADQVIITNGFTGALALCFEALDLKATEVLHEDPGYPLTRRALTTAGITVRPAPVDPEGLDVSRASTMWPNARAAIVTPGQQAPLGMQMSLRRRIELLEWAKAKDAWIIEDDYAGELQLEGRAAPALASIDDAGRVVHIGTFSKTIGPRIRLGYLVVPKPAFGRCMEVAANLNPAGSTVTQRAVSYFMERGHYLRHLRRVKRLYQKRTLMPVVM
jgi:GntR family transcriptional regulator/MocR family aminotransferase